MLYQGLDTDLGRIRAALSWVTRVRSLCVAKDVPLTPIPGPQEQDRGPETRNA